MKKFRFTRLLCMAMAAMFCLTACNGSDPVTTTTAAPDTTTAVTTATPAPEKKPEDEWVSAIFGGGPFYVSERGMKAVKESGFNTIMLWSVHVYEDGTLYLNDIKVAENGKYVGTAAVSEAWKNLKKEPTNITRIELSVGAWGTPDFERIAALMERDGTGEDTILYRNFKALVDACGADAINYDDESSYDPSVAIKFGRMVESMGLKVTLCPFTSMDYWVSVYNGLGGSQLVDRIYLQCYDGGAYNNVADWYRAFGNTKIIPGYWCLHYGGSAGDTAAQVNSKLNSVKQYCEGGFMWLYDDMKTLTTPNATQDYSEAINSVGRK